MDPYYQMSSTGLIKRDSCFKAEGISEIEALSEKTIIELEKMSKEFNQEQQRQQTIIDNKEYSNKLIFRTFIIVGIISFIILLFM